MAQVDQVADGRLGGRVVVDADEVEAVEGRRVDGDGRQSPLDRGRHERVVLDHAVQDEPVDGGVADGRALRRPVGQAGHEHDGEPLGIGGPGEPLQEEPRGRVVERIGKAIVEHDPDRAHAPGPQAAGQRIRAGVAQFGGRAQDPLAQRRGELVRAVVGVGDRRRGDAERPRHRHEPGFLRELAGPLAVPPA